MNSSLLPLLKRPPHFLLFHALDEAYAAEQARLFFCEWLHVSSTKESHPDLLLLEPVGKSLVHTMENIRSFLHEMALTPFSGQKRAVLIRHIERMLPSSSNALLKTLEEPPLHTVIIGTTERPYRLLSTIRSRAQEIGLAVSPCETVSKSLLPKAILSSLRQEWPFRSFTRLLNICNELDTFIHQSVDEQLKEESDGDDPSIKLFFEQDMASGCLHEIISHLLKEERIPNEKKSAFLAHCQEAFSSLDKQTSLKDVFVLLLNFEA